MLMVNKVFLWYGSDSASNNKKDKSKMWEKKTPKCKQMSQKCPVIVFATRNYGHLPKILV